MAQHHTFFIPTLFGHPVSYYHHFFMVISVEDDVRSFTERLPSIGSLTFGESIDGKARITIDQHLTIELFQQQDSWWIDRVEHNTAEERIVITTPNGRVVIQFRQTQDDEADQELLEDEKAVAEDFVAGRHASDGDDDGEGED
ncbi:hypothetical protein N0V94_006501 [Neodidymelliopsis sp. IMI 364377]|nr:hypothetical protein N0V94_006501 [Neodidymelliopsis sp. IMI 364377]